MNATVVLKYLTKSFRVLLSQHLTSVRCLESMSFSPLFPPASAGGKRGGADIHVSPG